MPSGGRQYRGETRVGPGGETAQGRADEPSLYIPKEVQEELRETGEQGPSEGSSVAPEGQPSKNIGGIRSISRSQPGRSGPEQATTDAEALRYAAQQGQNYRNSFLQGPFFSQRLPERRKEREQEKILDKIASQQDSGRPWISVPQSRLRPGGAVPEFTPEFKAIQDLLAGLRGEAIPVGDGRSFAGRSGKPRPYWDRLESTDPAFAASVREDPELILSGIEDLRRRNQSFYGNTAGDPSDISNTTGSGTLEAPSIYHLKIVDQDGNPVMVFDPATGGYVPKTRRYSSGDVVGVTEDPDVTAAFLRTTPETLGGRIYELRNKHTTPVISEAQVLQSGVRPTEEQLFQFGRGDRGRGAFVGMINHGGRLEPFYKIASSNPDAPKLFRVGAPTKYLEDLNSELAETFGIEYKGIQLPAFDPFSPEVNKNWRSTRQLADLVRRGDVEIYKPGERIYNDEGKRVTLSDQEVLSELKDIETAFQALQKANSTAHGKRTRSPAEVSQDPIFLIRDKHGLLGTKSATLQPVFAGLYPNGELKVARGGRKFEVPAIFHPKTKIRTLAEKDEGVGFYQLIDEMARARVPDPDEVSKVPSPGAREQMDFWVRQFAERKGQQPGVEKLVRLAKALVVDRSRGLPLTREKSGNRDPSVRYSAPSTYQEETENVWSALLDRLALPAPDQPRPRNPNSFPERREYRNPLDLIAAEKEYAQQLEAYKKDLQDTRQKNLDAFRRAMGSPAAPEQPDSRVSEAAAQAAVRVLNEEVGTTEHDALMRAIGASLKARELARIEDDLAGLAPITALPMESFRGNQAAYLQNLRASYGQDPEVRALTSRRTPPEYIEQAILDVPPGTEVGPRLQVDRITAADRLLRRYAEQRRDAEYIEQQDAQVARYGRPVTALAESMALKGMERLGRPITRDEALTLRDHLVNEYASNLAQQGASQEALSQLQGDVTEGILEAYARFNPVKPRMEQLNEEAARQQAGAEWQPSSDDIDATMSEMYGMGSTGSTRSTEEYDLGAGAIEGDGDGRPDDVLFTDPAAIQSPAADRALQRAKEALIRVGLKDMGFPEGRLPSTFRLDRSSSVREERPFPGDIAKGIVEQVLDELRRRDPKAYGRLKEVPYDFQEITRERL
jgi:hypothetical protein